MLETFGYGPVILFALACNWCSLNFKTHGIAYKTLSQSCIIKFGPYRPYSMVTEVLDQ